MENYAKLIAKIILEIGEDEFIDSWNEIEEFEDMDWEDIRFAYYEALDIIEEFKYSL